MKNYVEVIAAGPPLGTAGSPVHVEWTVTGEESVGGEYEVSPRGWVLPSTVDDCYHVASGPASSGAN